MKCINKKCGAELPDDAVYCLYCGRKQIREPHPKARGNGQGTVYKRGETWTAETTLGWRTGPDGKRLRITRKKGGFKNKKDGIAWLEELHSGLHPEGRRVTLSTLYDSWSTSAMLQLSKSKQGCFKAAWKRLNSIAYIDVGQLTIDDLQRCVDAVGDSYYSAKDIKSLLSRLFDRAVAQGDARANLAAFIVLPKLVETETEIFTQEEQARLWEDFSHGNDFPGYLLLMIYTGMMPGELLKLKKDMIDWEAQQIIGCGLKTKKRKETPIVLPDVILPVLDRLCSGKATHVCPMHEDDFYYTFNAYIGLMDFTTNLRPYSCRHSAATALDAAGVKPAVIQEVMRHSRFSTTERYIHRDTSAELAEVNAKIKVPPTTP